MTDDSDVLFAGQGHLCDSFVTRTRLYPESVFAVLVSRGEEQALTNSWVLKRALQIGGQLRNMGVSTGDLVAIVLEHCADLYPGFLGCMIHGFVPTFLPPLTTKQDPAIFRQSMAALFARTVPAAVITSAGSRGHVPAGDYAISQVESSGPMPATARPSPANCCGICPTRPARLLFCSTVPAPQA
jgi:acyl-CoA synthetase (AMP-forming)/AMP-acid ligase II